MDFKSRDPAQRIRGVPWLAPIPASSKVACVPQATLRRLFPDTSRQLKAHPPRNPKTMDVEILSSLEVFVCLRRFSALKVAKPAIRIIVSKMMGISCHFCSFVIDISKISGLIASELTKNTVQLTYLPRDF